MGFHLGHSQGKLLIVEGGEVVEERRERVHFI